MKAHVWCCVLIVAPALAFGFQVEKQPDKEKLEEGRYAVLKENKLVGGSEHSWTLWRLPDGKLQLEDHFEPAKEPMALDAAMLASGARMSPEFRKSLREAIEPSDIEALLDRDRQLLSLSVRGVKLDGSTGIGLKCQVISLSIECAGTSGGAKVHFKEPRQLFWWHRVPMLLAPWLAGLPENPPRAGNISILSFGFAPKENLKVGSKFIPGDLVSWGDTPALENETLSISNLGLDTLALGNKTFHAQKYRLEVKFQKGNPLSLNAWLGAKGLILAMEDSSRPGELIALIQYKKYSDLSGPMASPTTK